MRSIRTLSASLLSLVLAALVVLGTAGTAAADSSFQYWSYYQVKDGAFTYAPKGTGDVVPADGSIEGHRWSATPMGKTNAPRADLTELTFDSICAEAEAGAGEKRVAVIVDFGLEQDALGGDETPEPFADCAVVPEKATGLQVLDAVADVRTQASSMGTSLCAIDGYPSTSCADQSSDVASPADEVVAIEVRSADSAGGAAAEDEDDSNLPVLLGVGAAVVALGAGGALMARRNRA